MAEVIVPATTANLGPGFDVLGLSLNLYNKFAIEETDSGLEIVFPQGDGVALPANENNLVFRSAKRLFDEVGYKIKGIRITIENGFPLGRGLGSSSTAIVGGLSAANEVSGAGLSKDDIFTLAARIEGHPDNVGPAVFGGFAICYATGSGYGLASYKPSVKLKPVLLIPDNTLATRKARAVLPKKVSLEDAVYNIARSSLLVSALLTGKSDILKIAMEDKLHQPYRAKLIPGLMEIMQELAGQPDVGVALSGAGPSIVCIIDRASEIEFCGRVELALKEKNWDYTVESCEFDLGGAKVTG